MPSRRSSSNPPLATAGLGGVALLGGLLVVAVAEPLSRSDIGGPGWSLRGNGALIVPFAGGPAILGGCWGALAVLRWPGRAGRWPAAALVAGGIALVASLVAGFLPVLVGPGGGAAVSPGSPAATVQVLQAGIIPLVTAVAGLLLARWLFDGLGRRALLAALGVWVVVALVSAVAGGVAFLLQPFVLPLLATLPALASAPEPGHGLGWSGGWVAAGLLLVPVCGVLGYLLAVRVVS